MTSGAPLSYIWDGEALRPASSHWARQCDKELVIGERIEMVEYHSRSSNSHRHYFAAVTEVWRNLPEALAERFPTPDHLRKFALISTGYCDSHTLICSSKAEALRLAAFITPCDAFAVVKVTGAAVERFTAKSQSSKAMGHKAFQESKDAVLDFISGMVGVAKAELQSVAGQAA